MSVLQFPLSKFGTVDGAVKMLTHNSVFISSPLDLNDSFEMRPQWTQDHQNGDQASRMERDRTIANFPIYAEVSGKIQQIGNMPTPPAGDENEFNPKMKVEDQYGIAEGYNYPVARYLHETYRVLSLVENVIDTHQQLQRSHEGDVLMWAHYADMFQGVAILLDPEQFPNGLENPNGRLGFPINYRPERVSMPSWIYRYLSIDPSPLLHPDAVEALDKAMTTLLTTKSERWNYERELRMLYPMDMITTLEKFPEIEDRCPDCKANGTPFEKCATHTYRDAVHITGDAIVGIIFGPEVTSDSLSKIAPILREKRYEHLKLYRSSHNGQEYRMDYIEDSLDDIEIFQREFTNKVGLIKKHIKYAPDDSTSMMRFAAQKTVNLNQRRSS